MSISQIIIFAFFILTSTIILLFLTYLHKRFFNYSKVLEIIIHITRSYLLFYLATVIVIYFSFKQISLYIYVLCGTILFLLNLFSAIVFYFLQKNKKIISPTASSEKTESNNIFIKPEGDYNLTEDTKIEILNILQNYDSKKLN